VKGKKEAHRNALMLAFALTGFVMCGAALPIVMAWQETHYYLKYVDDMYTDWDHDGWCELITIARNQGPNLAPLTLDTDYDSTFPPWNLYTDSTGQTKVSDTQRIGWARFICQEWRRIWWVYTLVREEEPILNTKVTYHGYGVFSYYDWYVP